MPLAALMAPRTRMGALEATDYLNMKILNHFLPTLGVALAFVSPVQAMFIEDFELNANGITEISSGASEDLNSTSNIIERVASNAGDFLPGVETSSVGGGGFGEVRMGFETLTFYASVQGDRVKWNDGAQSGLFQSGFGHRVDVYFEDPLVEGGGFYAADDGFYFQPTLLDDTNTFAINGGGFGVRLVEDDGLVWRLGADGNDRGFSGVSGSTYDITAVDTWYTFETIWVENLSGGIDQVNRLYVAGGGMLFEDTIENVLLDSADAGQVGAVAFGNGDQNGLLSLIGAVGIDNASVVPEPGSFALIFGVIAMGFGCLRRRR